jgi:NAD(P)-dependent dehydrogenase (short-subunit alcohol dehydrogenase family)
VLTVTTDVADAASVRALAAAALERFGRVDVVCNNAGVLAMGPAWSFDAADWRRVIDVNLLGVVHGITAFVPTLIEQGRPAHVVNTASMAGVTAVGGIAPYVATKHGVVALSEVLAMDLATAGADHVGVSVLCPGYVPSRLGRPADQAVEEPAPGQPSADDVAAVTFTAIEERRFYVFTHDGSTKPVQRRAAAIVDGRRPAGLPTT